MTRETALFNHLTHHRPFLFDREYFYLDEIDENLILIEAVDHPQNPDKSIESYCQPFDTELHLLTLIEEALK